MAMDKTLSQEEVDALLQAMKSGEVKTEEEPVEVSREEVKVQEYNFRKPRLVSGDQLHGFEVIHDQFAKSLQSSLFVSLKNAMDIKLVAIDQFTYGEFILSLLKPTYVAVVGTSPSIGDLCVEMNLSVVMTMIDLLLGGDGSDAHEPRELTPIELSISTDLMQVVLNELRSAWASVADLTFRAQSYEFNPEYVQLTTSEALVMSVTIDLRLGDISGVMNICYPFQMIQPMLGKLSGRIGARRQATRADRSHEDMLLAMAPVPLDLHAVVGHCRVSAQQLAELKIGDVLCLDRRWDSPVEVCIGERPFYMAEVGRRKRRLAVRLLRPHGDEDESGP